MEKTSKKTVKEFVEKTINRYITTDEKLKKKYENNESRMLIKDALTLRIEVLEQLKKDLILNSKVLWED